MSQFPSFEDEYLPRLRQCVHRDCISDMESAVKKAGQTNLEEAEQLLNDVADRVILTVKHQMDNIKESVKQKRINDRTSENTQRYVAFVKTVTEGIRSTEGLFDSMFRRFHDLVSQVLGWIRTGVQWVGQVVAQTFAWIRSLFGR
jgi:phage-related protein